MYFNDYYCFDKPAPTPPIDVAERRRQLNALDQQFAADFATSAFDSYFAERDALIRTWYSPDRLANGIFDGFFSQLSKADMRVMEAENPQVGYVIPVGFHLGR